MVSTQNSALSTICKLFSAIVIAFASNSAVAVLCIEAGYTPAQGGKDCRRSIIVEDLYTGSGQGLNGFIYRVVPSPDGAQVEAAILTIAKSYGRCFMRTELLHDWTSWTAWGDAGPDAQGNAVSRRSAYKEYRTYANPNPDGVTCGGPVLQLGQGITRSQTAKCSIGIGGSYDWFYESVGGDGTLVCYGSTPGQTLTLTSAPNQNPPDPRPAGTGGKSTHELIAKVTENGNPKAGVDVTFKVDVVPMTGGHGHHDSSRPKGSVPASGVSNADGEIKLIFQASIVAGSHNITATCDSCSNKTAVKKVDVLVPDLQPVSANPPRLSDGTYVYALTAHDPTHVGTSGGRQRGEYYLTSGANDNLRELMYAFVKQGWGTVALNDASLNWGGIYDINNNWHPPHSTHRLGEDIDISFTRAGNLISKKKQKDFYKRFCEEKSVSVPFRILHHYQKIPHFHVYLMGQKKCLSTPN